MNDFGLAEGPAATLQRELNTPLEAERMNRPMIENSDRGITLNKPLAWSMLVAIVGLVWFGGSTIARLQGATENLTAALNRTEQTIAGDRNLTSSIEARVRVLETTTTRQDVKFDMLSRSLDEVKGAQRETNELLRQLKRSGG